MASRAGIFLLLMLLAKPLAREAPTHWVVWNVGQGLWTTLVNGEGCWHFDMGGERAPWMPVMKLCREQRNFLHLSHWDSDHINFSGRASYFLPNLCRVNWPAGAPSDRKVKMVKRIAECLPMKSSLVEWTPASFGSSNDSSSVIRVDGIVVPGDSSKAAEKQWAFSLPGISRTKVLLLGHHGSRTSTSSLLLSRMPRLQMAIASARRRRYGHPHEEVQLLLRAFKVPLLNTEDWGHIHIWL